MGKWGGLDQRVSDTKGAVTACQDGDQTGMASKHLQGREQERGEDACEEPTGNSVPGLQKAGLP